MGFREILFERMIEWTTEEAKRKGKRPAQREFSDWLGIPDPTVNAWLSGRRVPHDDQLHQVAEKLGPEVYDQLGVRRPIPDDPMLKSILDIWPGLTVDQQNKILETAERYAEKEASKDHHPKVSSSGYSCAAS